jgi:hypothetical protein
MTLESQTVPDKPQDNINHKTISNPQSIERQKPKKFYVLIVGAPPLTELSVKEFVLPIVIINKLTIFLCQSSVANLKRKGIKFSQTITNKRSAVGKIVNLLKVGSAI